MKALVCWIAVLLLAGAGTVACDYLELRQATIWSAIIFLVAWAKVILKTITSNR